MAVKGKKNYLEKNTGFPGGDNVIKMEPALFLGWRGLAQAHRGPERPPRAQKREDHHLPPLSTGQHILRSRRMAKLKAAYLGSGPASAVLSKHSKMASKPPSASSHAFVELPPEG